MDAAMMLSPVGTVRCGRCRNWMWVVGDPLLDHCRYCEHQLGDWPLYALTWDDVRPGG